MEFGYDHAAACHVICGADRAGLAGSTPMARLEVGHPPTVRDLHVWPVAQQSASTTRGM